MTSICFCRTIEESKGDINDIIDNLNELGEVTDDLSLVKVTYLKKSSQQKQSEKVRKLYLEAKDKYRQDEVGQCIQLCESAIEEESASGEVVRLLGYAHFKKKNFEKSP